MGTSRATSQQVRIVTDSACDLPPSLCDELGISVVPLTIRFGDQEFVDRRELSADQFWTKVRTVSQLPETAAPSVGAFEETFRSLADDGAAGVVCINLSSRMSATMQSAQVAAKALDGLCPIEVIDSKSATMGIGSLVAHAARLALDGADVDTITASVVERRERSHLIGIVDTLDYLRKGGRIGGAQAFLGSVLSIKPIIEVKDGAVEAAGKVRTRSKALRFAVDQLKESTVDELAVMHAQAEDLDQFLDMLDPIVPRDQILVGMIGPVVGVHTGPGTIGIVWSTKPELP
jgi:DegV family protein with EDD domain